MSRKNVQVANFNVIFLEKEDEAPLLKYFDSIVMPALQSGIRKKNNDTTYLFTDVEVKTDSKQEYVLTGKIVKKTIIEIKSDLDETEHLIEKDERYSAAPFSAFAIYLRNHRMIYVQNQKGSPTIASFGATVKYVFAEYIKKHNENCENEKEYLPFPVINVVGYTYAKTNKRSVKGSGKNQQNNFKTISTEW